MRLYRLQTSSRLLEAPSVTGWSHLARERLYPPWCIFLAGWLISHALQGQHYYPISHAKRVTVVNRRLTWSQSRGESRGTVQKDDVSTTWKRMYLLMASLSLYASLFWVGHYHQSAWLANAILAYGDTQLVRVDRGIASVLARMGANPRYVTIYHR